MSHPILTNIVELAALAVGFFVYVVRLGSRIDSLEKWQVNAVKEKEVADVNDAKIADVLTRLTTLSEGYEKRLDDLTILVRDHDHNMGLIALLAKNARL